MSGSEMVQLVGMIAAILVGSIVFLFLFFRGMTWVDAWMKQKTAIDSRGKAKVRSKASNWSRDEKSTGRRNVDVPRNRNLASPGKKNLKSIKNLERRAFANRIDETSSASRVSKSNSGMQRRESIASQRQRMLEQKAIQEVDRDPLTSLRSSAEVASSIVSNPINVRSLKPEPASDVSSETVSDKIQVATNEPRTLLIHLTCGEIIEPVSILDPEDSEMARKEIGYHFKDIVVARGQDGRIFLIREECIKLAIWGPEKTRTIASIKSEAETLLVNDSRDDSSIRRIIP